MAAAVMQVDDRASTPTPSIARCIATLEGHEERVWHCAWSRDGTQLASCGSDRSVRLWRRSGDSFVNSATLDDAHDRTVRRVAWAPCGTLLAATSFDATCCVWRRSRQDDAWEILATLEGHENEVKGCAWNASASLLATCSRDKSVWLWEFVDDEAFELLTVLHGHEGDVKTVDFDTCSSLSEDDLLVSCSYDDTLRVWGDDGDDWSCRCTLEGHASTVWDASFCATSNGARRIVSCGADLSVRVWAEASVGDASKWVQLAVLENVHNRPVYSCAVSGNRIASCGADDALVILSFDVDSGALAKLGRVDACHAGDANAVRWNPACADMLATAGDDGVVRVWRVSS